MSLKYWSLIILIPFKYILIKSASGDRFPTVDTHDKVDARIVEKFTGVWWPSVDERDEVLIQRLKKYSHGKDHVHAKSPYHFLRIKAPQINKVYVTDVREEEEVKKFNKYGSDEYVKRHNLSAFRDLKSQIINL